MKNIFNYKALVLSIFLCFGGNSYCQQNINKNDIVNYDNIVLPEGSNYSKRYIGNTLMITPIRESNQETRAGEYYNVKIKGIPSAGCIVSQCSIYNKETHKDYYFDGANQITKDIPQGTYDMFVLFEGVSMYYVFKENILIDKDTEIEFNQEEASNSITYKLYDEKGDELYVDRTDKGAVTDEGKLDHMRRMSCFLHEDYGTIIMTVSGGYYPAGYEMEYFINNPSNKYSIGSGGFAKTKSGSYYNFKNIVTEFKTAVYSNNPNEVAHRRAKFIPSPYMRYDKESHVPGYRFDTMVDGEIIIAHEGYNSKEIKDECIIDYYLCCNESKSDANNKKFDVMFHPRYSEFYYINEEDGKKNFIFTAGCGENGNKGAVNMVSGGVDTWAGMNSTLEYKNGIFYPGHPLLSEVTDSEEIVYGNVCPAMVLRLIKYEDQGKLCDYTNFGYIGRHSEIYNADIMLAEVNGYLDGEYNIYEINNNNVEVDGIKGKNSAIVRYNNTNKDNSAVTLTMLTFKDKNGHITDNFENIDGAKMYFTGGDMSYIIDNKTWISYYKCKSPTTVKVSYAPNGSDSWKELSVNENHDMFLMPTYGCFFEVALDNIKHTSENKWYNIKIEMEDADGNSMVQIIEPAFKINSDTNGIEMVNNDNVDLNYVGSNLILTNKEEGSFTIYTISGSKLIETYGNKTSLDTLAPGVYIANVKLTNGNSISKRIIIK